MAERATGEGRVVGSVREGEKGEEGKECCTTALGALYQSFVRRLQVDHARVAHVAWPDEGDLARASGAQSHLREGERGDDTPISCSSWSA